MDNHWRGGFASRDLVNSRTAVADPLQFRHEKQMGGSHMRKIQGAATAVLVVIVLLPIPIPGQERPVTRELGAMVTPAAPVELATNPVTVQIVMRDDARQQIETALAPSSRTNLILSIEGIAYDKAPEVHYEVYLDLPKDATPSYKSIYFVGNLAFFQPRAGAADRASVARFDITKTVRALKSFKLWNDAQVSVTFVMSWLVDREGRQLPVPAGVRLRFSTAKVITSPTK